MIVCILSFGDLLNMPRTECISQLYLWHETNQPERPECRNLAATCSRNTNRVKSQSEDAPEYPCSQYNWTSMNIQRSISPRKPGNTATRFVREKEVPAIFQQGISFLHWLQKCKNILCICKLPSKTRSRRLAKFFSIKLEPGKGRDFGP
jgi:hypothetical protein